MTSHRPASRHLPQRDPMMTNWYLIRATEIRERAIQAVEQQEAADRAQPAPAAGRMTRALAWLRTHRPRPLACAPHPQPTTPNPSRA